MKRRRVKAKFLSSREAVRQLDEGNADRLFFPLVQVCELFGWAPADLLPYLASGEITAFAYSTDSGGSPGPEQVLFRGDQLIEFMARHNLRFVTEH